jgi:hypothetical protein
MERTNQSDGDPIGPDRPERSQSYGAKFNFSLFGLLSIGTG